MYVRTYIHAQFLLFEIFLNFALMYGDIYFNKVNKLYETTVYMNKYIFCEYLNKTETCFVHFDKDVEVSDPLLFAMHTTQRLIQLYV